MYVCICICINREKCDLCAQFKREFGLARPKGENLRQIRRRKRKKEIRHSFHSATRFSAARPARGLPPAKILAPKIDERDMKEEEEALNDTYDRVSAKSSDS